MLKIVQDILNQEYRDNSIGQYLMALGVLLITLGFLHYVFEFAYQQLSKVKNNSFRTVLSLNLKNVSWPLYAAVSVYLASEQLNLKDLERVELGQLLLVVSTYYIIKVLHDWILFIVSRRMDGVKKEEAFDPSKLGILNGLVSLLLWTVGGITILPYFGVNVTALTTSLGITGLVIAFSLQNILADLFASISIYFDKPFQLGDFIQMGEESGQVIRIGLKTTRLRTLQGEELIISNKELSNSRIHNLKRMETRRVQFQFGILPTTDTTKFRHLPTSIKEIVEKQPLTRFDRAHLKEFTPATLNFEIVYFLSSNNYNIFMNTQQEINMQILEHFEREEIKMM